MSPTGSWFRKPYCTLPLLLTIVCVSAAAQDLTLQNLVTPSTVIVTEGKPIPFAIHGFIQFQSLAEAFPYIDSQTGRWPSDAHFDHSARERLGRQLLHEAIESRVVSMLDERPLEILITHTAQELKDAIAQVKEPVPAGYVDSFLKVQDKWKHSLNCWSASLSIPGRVLSNWYPIEEGIVLYGDTYDSTEHFWQAVKYHPEVTVQEVTALLDAFQTRDWGSWLARLDKDATLYLPNAYAVEFLRHNLAADRLRWFREELPRQGVHPGDHPRQLQQRHGARFRFSAFQEKVLWGDLADLFHLVYIFSPPSDAIRNTLAEHHFDAVYLGDRKMGFISEDFRSMMLDIWKVKLLQMPRFREVLVNIPVEIRLEHFLNDGDSPDIPIPVYVGYLNEMREMARKQGR
ncbi:MAG TPA: hypothetical protein VMU05_00285 [Dongiaceae bacterium]|nr:hypothetical protein [Dongiaceae bacterium]